ncbi:hypothetical protein DFQ27_000338 [Actinomortierella ambigua]|uniref:Protein kinase domain-containing protein n=1 Tax=Actinomortierella ambigua TaxID=1343610 RepID=A0A9P6QD78_9FUNG|nr:hypothetical protein DFQ27_000338 [Actinomortierella ambigua]
MEYAENGSLTNAIQSKCLNWEDKKRISHQIICGLAYMHSCRVLHRDLKSDNVLLTDGMKVAKLCDFGLAKLKPLGQTPDDNDGHVGTRRWMAPELFDTNTEHTTKTDVYSLGWILWQVAFDITRPFDHLDEDDAIEQVKKGARGRIPDETPDEVRRPIEGFWQHKASSRPEAGTFLDENTFPQGQDDVPTLTFSFGTSVEDISDIRDDEMQMLVSTINNSTVQSLTISPHLLPVQQQFPRLPTKISPPTESSALKIFVRDFKQLAYAENMYAQFALGMMFLKSKGSVQSNFEAFYWFKKAAELGHPEAQFYIGDLYERDRLLHKDVGRAVHWYGKAAEQNHPEAMRRLLAFVPPNPMCDQDYTYPSDDQTPRSSDRHLGGHRGHTNDHLPPHAPFKSDSGDPSSNFGGTKVTDSGDSHSDSGALRKSGPPTTSLAPGKAENAIADKNQTGAGRETPPFSINTNQSVPTSQADSTFPFNPTSSAICKSVDHSSQLNVSKSGTPNSASAIFKRIEQHLPDIIFFQATVGKILSDLKTPMYAPGERDPAVVDALRKLHVIIVMLSSSGLALSLDNANINEVCSDLSRVRQELCRSLGMHDNAINVEEEEQKDASAVRVAQAKLSKKRSNAKLLFREFRVREEQIKKFFLDKDNLRLDEIIAEDNISKTFKGEIIAGDSKGKKVHVKEYTKIAFVDLNVIAQRIIFLTQLMNRCENIARPRFAVPSAKMIVVDPITHMTLGSILQAGAMTKAQKIEVSLKIAGALAFVHTFDILHRDIRASNVFMIESTTSDGRTVTVPKLTGFEICRDRQGDNSRGDKFPKQPMYAPEIATGHGASLKSDVFSFGVLMYEISMGKSPPMEGKWVTQQDVDIWQSQEHDQMSGPYSDLLARCISFDPEGRPSMKEVAEMLVTVASEQSLLYDEII